MIFLLAYVMALRRSRRLRGLAPEETELQQVCFICQRSIDINTLTRCQRTSCCGVFMHKSCHHQMVSRLPTCGNCRHENEAGQREIVLETDEEVESDEDPFSMGEGTIPTSTHVERELIEYRRDMRYLNTHYPGSLFWQEIPYVIDPGVWLDYYHKLELFTRLFAEQPLYVHGIVRMPCEATCWMRWSVYRMFMFNTPFSVFDVTRSFRFRFLFFRDTTDRSLRISHLSLLPFSGGPPLYPDSLFC